MNAITAEILIIILLLAANGVFAMTEIAVVSARKARLRRLAATGDLRARAALELAESPNRFLATVQVGITLVGVLAGAFGGATIAEEIAAGLQGFTMLAAYGEAIGLGVVVVGITFCSLILGELVPKRIGLNNPERIARLMAGPMNRLAWLASPLVRLLSASTELVLRVIRLKKPSDPPVTEEEVKVLIQEGVQAGVFDRREPEMVEGVLALDRLPVRDIMTPRAKIIWINRADPHAAIWHKVVVSGHSHFPVYEKSRDQVTGVISLKAIYANLAAGIPVKVDHLVMPAMFVSGGQTVAGLLEMFKRSGRHVALVTDEAGCIIGLVTVIDVMEAIVGEFPSPSERLKPEARERTDGSWLVDGYMPLEGLSPLLPALRFPPAEKRDYATLGEFAAVRLGRAPREGETFDEQGFRFEALDMDGRRVDKVLITPLDSGSPLLQPGTLARPPHPALGSIEVRP
jgi:putative hemolysin